MVQWRVGGYYFWFTNWKICMTLNKNSTDQEITEYLRKEGYSDKRIVSFLRGWHTVKGGR